MPDISELQNVLGIKLKDTKLLEQALVHSSYTNENIGLISGDNERLEYLGDAVLDFIVGEKLYKDYPGMTEGELTRFRAALVRRETLARVARDINLGDFLQLGKGEEAGGGRDKEPNLAGALEAVIAAIYLERGITVARRVVLKLLDREIATATSRRAAVDYKSWLQEITQSRFQKPPTYRLLGESGPEHDKVFMVSVEAGGQIVGRGKGKTKKQAEMTAALEALKKLDAGFTD